MTNKFTLETGDIEILMADVKIKLAMEYEEETQVVLDTMKKLKYNHTIFKVSVRKLGAVATAHRFIPTLTKGYTDLLLVNRVDLSIEFMVVKEKYKELFTGEEIRICKERLGI